MNPEGESLPEKVLEEHTSRVFQLYEAKSKSFGRRFVALNGFALVFFFAVLLPHISIQGERNRIEKRLEDLRQEIDENQKGIKPYRTAQAGIQKLHRGIKDGPAQMRRFILALEEERRGLRPVGVFQASESPFQPNPIQRPSPVGIQPPPPIPPPPPVLPPPPVQSTFSPVQSIRQMPQADPCRSSSIDDWVTCRVRNEMTRLFEDYRKVLKEDVVAAMLEVPAGRRLVDTAALERAINRLLSGFMKKLAENPRFWKTFDDKTGFSVELDKEVQRFWKEFDSAIEEQLPKLESELKTLESARSRLETNQTSLKTREGKIAKRLSQIEFPFGKIPLALEEAVAAFPVLLAFGFLFCAVLFRDTIRLRKEFQQLYQRKDRNQILLNDQQVALVAPLWVDPVDPQQNRILQFALYAVPFLVFLLACGLISYGWTISGAAEISTGFSRTLYGTLYALCFVVFAYAFWQTVLELHNYTGKDG